MKPNTSTPHAADVHALLQAEYAAMDKLQHILNQETLLLGSSGNMQELSELVSRKNRLVDELKDFARKREQLRASWAGNSSSTDMEAFLETQEEADALLALWQQLLLLTASCREVNQMNGAIIKLNEQHMQHAISLLRDTEPEDVNYDAKGSTMTTRQSRLLGQA